MLSPVIARVDSSIHHRSVLSVERMRSYKWQINDDIFGFYGKLVIPIIKRE
jgi:hypothetical protein